MLDGLRADEAAALRAELLHRARGATTAGRRHTRADAAAATGGHGGRRDRHRQRHRRRDRRDELARLDPRWIWYAPLTLSGVRHRRGADRPALAAAERGAGEPGEARPRRGSSWTTCAAPRSGSTSSGSSRRSSCSSSALLSVIGYVLAFWGFRLTRHPGGSLHISAGPADTPGGEHRRAPTARRRAFGAAAAARGPRRAGLGDHDGAAHRGGSDRSETLLPPGPLILAQRIERAVLRDAAPIDADRCPARAWSARRRYARALVPTAARRSGARRLGRAAARCLPDRPSPWPRWRSCPRPCSPRTASAIWVIALLPDWLVTRTGSLHPPPGGPRPGRARSASCCGARTSSAAAG